MNTGNHHTDDVIVCALEKQLASLPVEAQDIATATNQDQVLSQVYKFTLNGWPKSLRDVEKELKFSYTRRLEISISNECILWEEEE